MGGKVMVDFMSQKIFPFVLIKTTQRQTFFYNNNNKHNLEKTFFYKNNK